MLIGEGEVEDGVVDLFDDVFSAEAVFDEEIVELVSGCYEVTVECGGEEFFDVFWFCGGCGFVEEFCVYVTVDGCSDLECVDGSSEVSSCDEDEGFKSVWGDFEFFFGCDFSYVFFDVIGFEWFEAEYGAAGLDGFYDF